MVDVVSDLVFCKVYANSCNFPIHMQCGKQLLLTHRHKTCLLLTTELTSDLGNWIRGLRGGVLSTCKVRA